MKITDEMLSKVPALQIGQWFHTDNKTDGWQILVGLDGSLQVHKLDRERGTAAIFGFEAGMQAYIRAVLDAALSAAPPVEYAGLVEQAGEDEWSAAGLLGMTPETLRRIYAHHHPDFQSGPAWAIEHGHRGKSAERKRAKEREQTGTSVIDFVRESTG